MNRHGAFVPPPVGSVWWSDGEAVLPLTEAEILGWLARGVSRGSVSQNAETARFFAAKNKDSFLLDQRSKRA